MACCGSAWVQWWDPAESWYWHVYLCFTQDSIICQFNQLRRNIFQVSSALGVVINSALFACSAMHVVCCIVSVCVTVHMCTVSAAELTNSHVNLRTIGMSDPNTACFLGNSALPRKQSWEPVYWSYVSRGFSEKVSHMLCFTPHGYWWCKLTATLHFHIKGGSKRLEGLYPIYQNSLVGFLLSTPSLYVGSQYTRCFQLLQIFISHCLHQVGTRHRGSTRGKAVFTVNCLSFVTALVLYLFANYFICSLVVTVHIIVSRMFYASVQYILYTCTCNIMTCLCTQYCSDFDFVCIIHAMGSCM